MREFRDKVAVITGAASGIGRALAEHCAQEGMKVVLAGINAENLKQTQLALEADGATVTSVQTDVSKLGDIEALAERTLSTFGAVHLLVNNAGVAAGSNIWESTWADWEWVIGVNLWGVIHGLKVFVPVMLAQDTEGHIVNNASIAGILSYHPSAAYQVTKHGVVALSEQLHHSLVQQNAKIKASVLCPGWVHTQIMNSERNRPAELQNEPRNKPLSPQQESVIREMYQALQAGILPQQVAEHTFRAIRAEQFYILTHPEYNPMVQKRMEDILQQRNPA